MSVFVTSALEKYFNAAYSAVNGFPSWASFSGLDEKELNKIG